MYLKNIKINNYKSFNNEANFLNVEEINTVIGKNESGKSNLIKSLSGLNFSGVKDINLFKNCNKNSNENVSFDATLILTNREREKYNFLGDTIFKFNSSTDIDFSGSLSTYLETHTEMVNAINLINEEKSLLINLANDSSTKEKMIEFITVLNQYKNKILIGLDSKYKIAIKRILNSEYDKIKEALQYLLNELNRLYDLLPKFIEIKDLQLKQKYTKNMISDHSVDEYMLNLFLSIFGYDQNNILYYWTLTSADDKQQFEEKLNNSIFEFISNFNKFYSQDVINMKIRLESDSINFIIKTKGVYINLNERSNGLKWYLNAYIQIMSQIKNHNLENLVILLDEPGVYLHVDAQKELLNFFENLIKQNNQIIYTTHSPFMIYQDKLERVKLIYKDDKDNSKISNCYYNLDGVDTSKMETLSPLMSAIGMSNRFNLVGNDNKINIITEGISDYFYLKSVLFQLNEETMYHIIPSIGASNIQNIVSILIGWGYKYKILFDQDVEGRREQKKLVKKLLVNPKEIIFSDGTNIEDTKINLTIEDLFSIEDKNKIGINIPDYEKSKKYYSFITYKKIEKKEITFTDSTISNFRKIFDMLEKN